MTFWGSRQTIYAGTSVESWGSEDFCTLDRHVKDFQASDGRCEKCAIILEGLTAVGDVQRYQDDRCIIVIAGGIDRGTTASVYLSDESEERDVVEFYTVQGMLDVH